MSILIVLIALLVNAEGSSPATRPAHRFAPTRFDARVAELRAAGQPVVPAELRKWPRLGEKENGVRLLLQMAEGMQQAPAYASIMNTERPRAFSIPLEDSEVGLLKTWMAEIAVPLKLSDELDAVKGFDWGDPPANPMGDREFFQPLSKVRQVVWMLRYDAALAVHERDGDRYLRRIKQITRIRDAAGDRPLLISGLVTVGLDAGRTDTLTQAAWLLPVGDDERQIDRSDVESIIAELLDDAGPTTRFDWALRSERGAVINTLDRLAAGLPLLPDDPPDGFANEYLAARALSLSHGSGEIILDHFQSLLDELSDDASTRQAAIARRKEMETRLQSLKGRFAFWSNTRLASILIPAIRPNHVLEKLITQRHVAATALAVRLYRLDHEDQPPKSLEELVPKYLPRLPIDRATADRSPLRYRIDATGPIVWSVGQNGVDDNGYEGTRTMSLREMNETTDQVTHLAPQPRPAMPKE